MSATVAIVGLYFHDREYYLVNELIEWSLVASFEFSTSVVLL
jgi:hypothetical protein